MTNQLIEKITQQRLQCVQLLKMTEVIASGKYSILVMLDLSAAFDTVRHDLLLEDLRAIGIEDVYRWHKSYLENRSVTVVVSNAKSVTKSLTKGVPQGSVLGPLLFTIYTIELSKILKRHNVKFKLYADDTQFYFPVETVDEASKKIEEIMKDIKRWMTTKKLKLNEDKTECMLFGSANAIKKHEDFKTLLLAHRL